MTDLHQHDHSGNNGKATFRGDTERDCPKCGALTPLRYLTYGRCPDCVVAEVRANQDATTAEFLRLKQVEERWYEETHDRRGALGMPGPTTVPAPDGRPAEVYRRLATILLGAMLGGSRPRAESLQWLHVLAWNDSPLIPEDAALIDAMATPE